MSVFDYNPGKNPEDAGLEALYGVAASQSADGGVGGVDIEALIKALPPEVIEAILANVSAPKTSVGDQIRGAPESYGEQKNPYYSRGGMGKAFDAVGLGIGAKEAGQARNAEAAQANQRALGHRVDMHTKGIGDPAAMEALAELISKQGNAQGGGGLLETLFGAK